MFFRRKQQAVGWLVVFLGNPGPRYRGTRHNIGFMTADAFEKKNGVRIDRLRFHALTASCTIGGEKALLMKPQTFMNLSGGAVHEAAAFYKVPTDHILVVSDDISLPLGKLRIRREGSAGGHNGLKDIIAKCGGEGFPRIKIGAGIPPEGYDTVDWVLSVMRGQEAEDIAAAVDRAADAVTELIEHGADAAMAKYN